MIQTSRIHPGSAPRIIAISGAYVAWDVDRSTELPTLVTRMIALFDGTRTVEEVCQEVQISVARGLSVVRKLNAQGRLKQAAPGPRPTSDLERADTLRDLTPLPSDLGPPPFSADEEAFFASEVTPIDECDEPFLTVRERIGLAFAGLLRVHEAA